jgi:ABC-type dipeptide/oligopeptide/nickel transport system ATPase component
MPLLELQNLETTFAMGTVDVPAVRGADLKVQRGTRHALVGQTGAGKSILALSVMRLLPENARISGKVLFQGRDLLGYSASAMERVRGSKIMMVFQNPLATLNPVFSIEAQLCEIPICHEGVSLSEARQRALQTLRLCELAQPEKVMRSHPFELSGGMLQRVAIAMGIICRPDLLIADEPFKGLDARLQQQVAATLYKVCRELSITLLIITHNLKVARYLCDVVSVMYGGRVLETAGSEAFFECPGHPYSQRLVDAFHLFSHARESEKQGEGGL